MMMDSIDTWTRFFGLWTLVNIGIYLISALMVLTMRDFLVRHSVRWFGVSEEGASRTVYQWIAFYKLGILSFGVAPWLALTLLR